MGKKTAKHGAGAAAAAVDPPVKAEKLANKEYLGEMGRLHAELVTLQAWLKSSGHRVIVVFEGRGAAGKSGAIKAITERVSPRVFRVAALPAPSEREQTQLYLQRYIAHFPAAGEIVLFDRSWYKRAGVERVMGFCTEAECRHFRRGCRAWSGRWSTRGSS